MSDPRLEGRHLPTARQVAYRVARDRVLDARGGFTHAAESAERITPTAVSSRYALVRLPDGVYIPLRVGLTVVGRGLENDVVLGHGVVSRRHCALVAHARGGCEVYDTASLNGTRVNGRRVRHAWLNAGDLLQLCDVKFRVAVAGCPEPPVAERADRRPDPQAEKTGHSAGKGRNRRRPGKRPEH